MLIQNQIKIFEKKKTKDIKNFHRNRLNICPDCECVCSWNTHFKAYICDNKECAFMADVDGKRIWDNKKREENLRNL